MRPPNWWNALQTGSNMLPRDALGGRGYGAQPHGDCREGYPTGLHPVSGCTPVSGPAGCLSGVDAASRCRSSRAKDAALRPENTAVQGRQIPPFLVEDEKSSAKSTPNEHIHRIKYKVPPHSTRTLSKSPHALGTLGPDKGSQNRYGL